MIEKMPFKAPGAKSPSSRASASMPLPKTSGIKFPKFKKYKLKPKLKEVVSPLQLGESTTERRKFIFEEMLKVMVRH